MEDNAKISNQVLQAVSNGNLETVKKIIKIHGLSYSPAWSNGYNLLRDAAKGNHRNICEFLLSSGCKVSSKASNIKHTKTPLHFAVEHSNVEIVQMLLNKGASVTAKDKSGKTVLHTAAEIGNLAIIDMLIDNGAEIEEKTKYDRETPLLVAAAAGNVSAVELLLRRDANIDTQDFEGKAALHVAVESNNFALVELLLAEDAHIDIEDVYGRTPLHLAAAKAELKVLVDVLLLEGASINKMTLAGKTALSIAIEAGNWETMKILLYRKADVNINDDNGRSPLHTAVEIGNYEIVKELLKYGAAVNSQTKQGFTPLDFANKSKSSLKIVNVLLNRGAKAGDQLIETPLFLAVKSECTELVNEILKDRPNKGNKQVLYTAIAKKNYEITEKLLEYGFAFNEQDAKNPKIIAKAIKNGYDNVVEVLLNLGADPNMYLTDYHFTLLHFATEHSQERIANLLISHGAVINAKDESGKSPIHYAVQNADLEMIELLLNRKAEVIPEVLNVAVEMGWLNLARKVLSKVDINAKTKTGRTALHYTALGSDDTVQAEIAELLLAAGANVNEMSTCPDEVSSFDDTLELNMYQKMLINPKAHIDEYLNNGATTLQAAIRTGFSKLVCAVLKHNADVNIKDTAFETPLILAVKEGHAAIVSSLIEKGADVRDGNTLTIAAQLNHADVVNILIKAGVDIDTVDEEGKTALHIAAAKGNDKVLTCLLEKGADVNILSGELKTALDYVLERTKNSPDFIRIPAGYEDFDDDFDDYDFVDDLVEEYSGHSYFGNPKEYSKRDCADILKRHVILMLAARLHVCEDLIDGLEEVDLAELNESSATMSEVELMKKSYMGNTTINFYNFLHKSPRQLVNLLKNEEIFEILHSGWYSLQFPLYGILISGTFNRGLYRQTLHNNVLIKSKSYSTMKKLPYECIELVLSYLTNADLVDFDKCFSHCQEEHRKKCDPE